MIPNIASKRFSESMSPHNVITGVWPDWDYVTLGHFGSLMKFPAVGKMKLGGVYKQRWEMGYMYTPIWDGS